MKIRIFLVLLTALTASVPALAKNQALGDSGARAVRVSAESARACISQEVGRISSAPVSPTEIAQAALYRCISKIDDYEGKAFSNAHSFSTGANEDARLEAAKQEARYARAQFESDALRMGVDLVIRARLTRQ